VADGATVGGGESNRATGSYSTVGGGYVNQATGLEATIAGGAHNTASGTYSSVSGGYYNTASGNWAAVLGGEGATASGEGAVVLGGRNNIASGDYSLAAGAAVADQSKCFIFSAWSGADPFPMGCFGLPNIIRFGADHGVTFDFGPRRPDGGGRDWVVIGDSVDILNQISTSSGASLTHGAWTDASDRNRKHHFEPVDALAVLNRVSTLPITTWSYLEEPNGVRHMGAVAQDFHAVFGLGVDDKHIAALDTGGVALAAIQGLYRVVQDKDATIAAQAREIEALKDRIAQRDERDDRQVQEVAELRRRLTDVELVRAELAALRAAFATLSVPATLAARIR